ncbi:protein of unknown function [Microbulbifer donghaiensis]|uniref:DUF3298 domain-containing protein n=1 Tax=Microbulbifer donghaiensis TaxID=494016 RepID=A0A1M5E7V8_9GAMM|nr:DUF3298 and DUF4163 domain-containing protein [Microbulbifer donghaiensis]SHF75141.1 protein of unknown function [Microbulbifer donghaiensis]
MPKRLAIKLFAALMALVALQGCDRQAPPQADTSETHTTVGKLTSKRVTFERQAQDCTPDEECSSVSVTRELIERQPALNKAVLNQLLLQLQSDGESHSATQSLEEIAAEFLTEAAEVERVSSAHWQLNGDAERLARRGDLLTMEIKTYRYTGGAHGIPVVEWFNWDLSAEKRVSLPQVLREGTEPKFWELAEAAHRRWQDEQTGIDDAYRETWQFQRSEDFRFNDDGIVLLYGVYVLGPYALGPVQLTVPWPELQTVVREQYLPHSQ